MSNVCKHYITRDASASPGKMNEWIATALITAGMQSMVRLRSAQRATDVAPPVIVPGGVMSRAGPS
eukprot:7079954-Heterocapsa_arctica.AAC.1